jgi:hypothetical protein
MATVTPAVERVTIPHNLELLEHQQAYIAARLSGAKNRLAIWHRQAGKDVVALVDVVAAAVEEPGIYGYCAPTYRMVKGIVWDGVRASDGLPYLSVIPPQLIIERDEAGMVLTLRTRVPGATSRLMFLSGDQAQRLCGLPFKGLVFTELSQFESSEALDTVRPSLVASGGWLAVISTPLGIGNAFHALYTMARESADWWVDVKTYRETRYRDGRPMISVEDVERELANGQRPEWIAQEYECRFVVGLVASIFGDVLNKAESESRIVDLPMRADVPTTVALDLGVRDRSVAVFVQPSGDWLHIVDVWEGENLALPGILQAIQSRGWFIKQWIAPHDLQQRDLSASGYGGQAVTREQLARRMGITFRIAAKLSISEGLDSVRRLFSRFKFDRRRCERLLEALGQYRRTWDPERRVFSDKPLHDWCSDYADALRCFAVGHREPRDPEADAKRQRTALRGVGTAPWGQRDREGERGIVGPRSTWCGRQSPQNPERKGGQRHADLRHQRRTDSRGGGSGPRRGRGRIDDHAHAVQSGESRWGTGASGPLGGDRRHSEGRGASGVAREPSAACGRDEASRVDLQSGVRHGRGRSAAAAPVRGGGGGEGA